MQTKTCGCGRGIGIVSAVVGAGLALLLSGAASAQSQQVTYPPTNFTQGSSPNNTTLNLNFNTGTLPAGTTGARLRVQYSGFSLACANTVTACGTSVGLCAFQSTGPSEIAFNFGNACAGQAPSPVVVDLTSSSITGASFFFDATVPFIIPTLSQTGLIVLALLLAAAAGLQFGRQRP